MSTLWHTATENYSVTHVGLCYPTTALAVKIFMRNFSLDDGFGERDSHNDRQPSYEEETCIYIGLWVARIYIVR